MSSAMFCEHANECPTGLCDCPADCYCRSHTCKNRALIDPEPAPIQNQHPAVWDLVIADMRARDQFGYDKYQTRLQPHNGRKSLRDAYQEALDLCVYLRQEIYEREGK